MMNTGSFVVVVTPVTPGIRAYQTVGLQVQRPVVCISGEGGRKDASGTSKQKHCLEHRRRRRQECLLSPEMENSEEKGENKDGQHILEASFGCEGGECRESMYC